MLIRSTGPGSRLPKSWPSANVPAPWPHEIIVPLFRGSCTKQTERSRAEDLLRALAEEALKGTVTWNKNVTQTIDQGIQAIDAALSKQLAAILHHASLQK